MTKPCLTQTQKMALVGKYERFVIFSCCVDVWSTCNLRVTGDEHRPNCSCVDDMASVWKPGACPCVCVGAFVCIVVVFYMIKTEGDTSV